MRNSALDFVMTWVFLEAAESKRRWGYWQCVRIADEFGSLKCSGVSIVFR